MYSDSDDEFDLKNWSSNVSTEILDKLSSKEKKRQEIINELYHTEKSHIRGNTLTNYIMLLFLNSTLVFFNHKLTLNFNLSV